jgi:hypothetical protein
MLLRRFPVESGFVTACTFNPDGRQVLIATASSGSTLSFGRPAELFETDTGREIRRFDANPQGEPVDAVEFSPDGRRILTLASGAQVWDVETGRSLLLLPQGRLGLSVMPGNGCVFSPDGRRIVGHSSYRTITIWKSDSGAQVCAITNETSTPRPEGFSMAQLSPNGKLILTEAGEGTARIWDAETGRLVREFVGSKARNGTRSPCALFTPNGHEVISSADDGIAILWEAKTGKEIRRFQIPGSGWGRVYKMTISSDGRRLITICAAGRGGSGDGAALWDVKSGRLIKQIDAGETIVGFSPVDERFITTKNGEFPTSWNGEPAALWDGATGEIIRRYNAGP